jgi:hypothetical protein
LFLNYFLGNYIRFVVEMKCLISEKNSMVVQTRVKERQLDWLIIILIVFGICSAGYFLVILPYLNRGEGDPRFQFVEVPVSETINSSVIHLTDKDIFNVRGLEVKKWNEKIYSIVFRVSETSPGLSIQDFGHKK